MSTVAESPEKMNGVAAANIAQRPSFKPRYDHFIGGKFVAPVKGEYFDNISPIDGQVFTQAARGTKEDVEAALDAAHAAFPSWSKTSPTERSNLLLKIAQVIEDNLEYLAIVETIDNGKAIRETRAAICRCAWTTSVILPALSEAKKVLFPNMMKIQ